MTERPIFYRYLDVVTESGLGIHLVEYVGVRRTRVSWWVVPSWMEHDTEEGWKSCWKRIEDYTMGEGVPPRRFAYPDKTHALRAYKRRKVMQIAHAKAALERGKAGIELATAGLMRLSRGEPAFDTDNYVVVMTGDMEEIA